MDDESEDDDRDGLTCRLGHKSRRMVRLTE